MDNLLTIISQLESDVARAITLIGNSPDPAKVAEATSRLQTLQTNLAAALPPAA